MLISDVLTMQSLRDKYTEKDILEVQLAAPYVNEQEFDNYVREFAIDDTISECFATSEESGSIFSLPVSIFGPFYLHEKILMQMQKKENLLGEFTVGIWLIHESKKYYPRGSIHHADCAKNLVRMHLK